MSSEPQEGSVREQLSAAKGTIVQNEEELCRQRRLLDSSWKWNPQVQLHRLVLPQHWMTEEEDLCNQQRNFRVKQEEPEPPEIKEELQDLKPPQIKKEEEEPEPPQIKEELQDLKPPHIKKEEEEPEPPQIKEEPGELCISQEEEGNRDEETDPQNRGQRKRRDRSHVQNVDSSHMSAVLPQDWMTEEEDLCNQQRKFRVEQEEPEPPEIKEEQEKPELLKTEEVWGEPEPSPIKEEPEELFISLDKERLNLKQETDTLMEIPTNEENENSEGDLNNQQSFNVTDSQDEEGNQHEESTSTTDEETDPQNRDQRKRRDRPHVQSVDSSNMSEGQCDSDVGKKSKKAALVKKRKQSPISTSSLKSGENSRVVGSHVDKDITEPVEGLYICKECSKEFRKLSYLKEHMRNHAKERPFSCEGCDKKYSRQCDLKKHMRTHTGEKPYSCEECDKSFKDRSHLRGHMKIHTGEKPFSCKECNKSFVRRSDLKRHMRSHTGEKLFSCKECDKGFSQTSDLKRHLRTHTGERPYSCKECNKSFSQISDLKRHKILYSQEALCLSKMFNNLRDVSRIEKHMRIRTGEKTFFCKKCS